MDDVLSSMKKGSTMRDTTTQILQELNNRYPVLEECMTEITQAAAALVSCFWQDGKLLACGNGGSAADCEHIVGELMKAFRLHRRLDTDKQRQIRETYPEQADVMIANLQRAVPAISLVSQTALMTAFGNDVSAQMLFAQQVLSYGRPGDYLLAISTSGNSENILHAARQRKEEGVSISKEAQKELGDMLEMVNKIIRYAVEMFAKSDESHMQEIVTLEDQVDEKERELQKKHVERLTKGECSPEAGMIFSDIVSGLERVADHATNIAFAITTEEDAEDGDIKR